MKKVKMRHSNSRFLLLALAALFFFSNPSFAQDAADSPSVEENTTPVDEAGLEGDVSAGKDLFNSLCAACHKPYKRAIGPALHGVTEKRGKEWLYSWIKNSSAMIEAGDPQAVAIYEEYNKVAMNAFPQLSNSDIDNILAYVEQPKPEPKVAVAAEGSTAAGQGGGAGVSTQVVLGILAFVLLLLLVVLFLVNKTLTRFAEANGVVIEKDEKISKPIWKAFVENQFLVIVTTVVLLLVGSYYVYGFFMQVGVDQGYAPVQPIHYSHKIHAGDNGIDCKYCHSSARVSKQSGIPSLNVCMNCHKSIAEVAPETATEEYSKEFYDGEIAKLYDAVGWDPATQSYTGEEKPVKWVRIHNLPDLAYFNHSQHVTVAGIECQKCHGPVEEMEIMRQHAPLTMGWCIECHRDTKVNMQGNEYYEKIHEELSKKYGVETLTAAQMGALECGKCHY
ncbi:cytochrome c3 family protein [Mesonia sediminis]|uniref:Cytochrome c3 family protein n=1 Tax=Mesonia sediminis TaxID=1703946 RepID=A0ABW5SB37_9FLAO